ncbi:MAG: hypothetical protein JJ934_03305 [Pseudomonadales bacterium]|nr:hypothetical protein [Pseudomonadales bacterium]
MTKWHLPDLFRGLDQDIRLDLETVNTSFHHSTTKGDASEQTWLELLRKYLPKRYQAEKAFVVDSNGSFSQQQDVVIFDRQYSPFIFRYQDQMFIPAESVYAVFEAKQDVDAGQIKYAQEKLESVRTLHRTSLPIPHAGGVYPPKPPVHIFGGILAFESDWNPPLGKPLQKHLNECSANSRLDLGCVAAHGYFTTEEPGSLPVIVENQYPVTDFLFELIAKLQMSGTVPMIDIRAYARWIPLNSSD